MKYTNFDSQDTRNKLFEYLKQKTDSKETDPSKEGYAISIFDKFTTIINGDYLPYKDLEELKVNLLNTFKEHELPEINQRKIIKNYLDNIEGIEPFKAYIKEIGF